MNSTKVWKAPALIIVIISVIPSSFASPLWYGGDSFGGGGIRNGVSTRADGKVYDDFEVTDSAGWRIREAWSNNLLFFLGGNEAELEIRREVRRGDGGELVFAGRFRSERTRTGRIAFGLPEYEIRVKGFEVFLQQGTYFLNVAPVGTGDGQSFCTYTEGQNGVGRPLNNGNSFYDSKFFGFRFEPVENIVGSPKDFSMGVAGEVVPEPATFAAFALGLAGIAVRRRGRRS